MVRMKSLTVLRVKQQGVARRRSTSEGHGYRQIVTRTQTPECSPRQVSRQGVYALSRNKTHVRSNVAKYEQITPKFVSVDDRRDMFKPPREKHVPAAAAANSPKTHPIEVDADATSKPSLDLQRQVMFPLFREYPQFSLAGNIYASNCEA